MLYRRVIVAEERKINQNKYQIYRKGVNLMKKIITRFISLLLIALFVSAQLDTPLNLSYAKSTTNTLGSTCSNISNGGWVTTQGDWIYYRNDALMGNLYKIKTNGKSKTQLNEDDVSYINVVGDWVYYLNNEYDEFDYLDDYLCNHLYKIKTDGTKRTMLSDDDIDSMQVQGDYIYYIQYGKLYRMNTDGTHIYDLKTKTDEFNIEGKWIVYKFASYLYKMKSDGTRKSKLDTVGASFALADGVAYYSTIYYNFSYDPVLFKKVPIDGSKRAQYLNQNDSDSGDIINVFGNWLYYINYSDNSYIYKINLDGSDKTKVSDCKADNLLGLYIVDDWIYYRDYDSQEFCRVRLDGTDNELVEPY